MLKGKMPKVSKESAVGCLKSNALTLATMAGVVCGIILGVCLSQRETGWHPREAMYVAYIGKLFLQMLKCIIIPLIIPSLIASVGSLDLSLSGKVGGRAVIYYLSTTLFAVVLGIILVVSIQPGAGYTEESDNTKDVASSRNVTTADTLMDLIRNCFPPNIVQATIQQYRTSLIYPGEGVYKEIKDGVYVNESDKYSWMFKGEYTNGTNILGLVVFSIVTGIAIAASGEDGKPLLAFFTSVSTVMMKITTWIIFLAPVGVCFLIAGQILQMDDFGKAFERLAMYFLTVLLGLSIHGGITLPLIYSLTTRTLPFKFIMNMGNALSTAFGTASSSATLPVTIESLEEKNGVDPRVSRFVLPIGATINMDGTALYEAIAAIFIAQLRGKAVGIGNVLAISITATAASIGAAGIPQAGLVTMVMVLDTVGLPAEDVGLILAVDWLLDRFRTMINVLGDAIGAGIVYHLSKNELGVQNKMDEEEEHEMKNGKENRSYSATEF